MTSATAPAFSASKAWVFPRSALTSSRRIHWKRSKRCSRRRTCGWVSEIYGKNGRFGTGWEIIRISLRLKGLDKEWIMNGWLVSNMNFIVHFIYGMSSFPLTFIFLKMVETTNQAKQWQSVLDAWYRISCMFWYWITKFLVIDLAFFENEGGTHP